MYIKTLKYIFCHFLLKKCKILIKYLKFDIIKLRNGIIIVKEMNISDEQTNKIIELASMQEEVNGREITDKDITKALVRIERKIYAFTADIRDNNSVSKNILIADDLELSIYQLTTVLKKVGINPRIARNKEEALSEISKVHFDCIIVDLFIPDCADGLELVRVANEKRKTENKALKIVVISGTDDKSLIEQCYTAGADFYISKDKDWHAKLLKFVNAIFFSHIVINIFHTKPLM